MCHNSTFHFNSYYNVGENRDGKLTIERFLEFQTQLQREILRLEFERKNPDSETNLITEGQFAELLLAYADYNAKKRTSVLKRVKKAYKKKKKKEQEDAGDDIVYWGIEIYSIY